MYLLGC